MANGLIPIISRETALDVGKHGVILKNNTPQAIIDEVQRCPELLLTVKYFVDKTKRKRYFILSESGNISLRQAPRETLAGRAKYLHLKGLSIRELRGLSQEGILDRVWEGQEIKPTDIKSANNMT
ncbi:MAG: AAA family ATPase, partial [Planctomycetes bacterium]|nr:AAA family ATPase [Planctomycetota bacterium]